MADLYAIGADPKALGEAQAKYVVAVEEAASQYCGWKRAYAQREATRYFNWCKRQHRHNVPVKIAAQRLCHKTWARLYGEDDPHP